MGIDNRGEFAIATYQFTFEERSGWFKQKANLTSSMSLTSKGLWKKPAIHSNGRSEHSFRLH